MIITDALIATLGYPNENNVSYILDKTNRKATEIKSMEVPFDVLESNYGFDAKNNTTLSEVVATVANIKFVLNVSKTIENLKSFRWFFAYDMYGDINVLRCKKLFKDNNRMFLMYIHKGKQFNTKEKRVLQYIDRFYKIKDFKGESICLDD